jgi:putative resolvase
VTEEPPKEARTVVRVAMYARVSSHEHWANLDRQVVRLEDYCAAKGYQVAQLVKEIASGVNDACPKLLALLKDPSMTHIVVEQKDHFTRFGYRNLETLLELQDRTMEVVNLADDDREDLLADLVSIV